MSSDSAAIGFRRSTAQKILFLLAIGAAIFTVPYFVPVRPAISVSYVVGFNNRAAVILLIGGALLFAWFTRGELARMDEEDGKLSVRILLYSLLTVLIGCLARIHFAPPGTRIDESLFFLNRQQLVASGMVLYRQLDFPYGPLLLYPGYWAAHMLRTTQVRGYEVWWVAQWLIGTAMMWAAVKGIDFPVKRRGLLYGLLFMAQLPLLRTGGANYAPLRMYVAVSAVLVVYTVRRRGAGMWLTTATAVLAVALTMSCSMEQAVGAMVGLGAYFLLLAVKARSGFSWVGVVAFGAGCCLCYLGAASLGMFVSFKAWAAGAFANPILASPFICVVLLAYVAAGCLWYRRIADWQVDSLAVPMTFAGCAMLPSAMGRCDMQHVFSAMPAFLVGAAAICAMPSVWRWWLVLALLGMVILPTGLNSPRVGNLLARAFGEQDKAVPATAGGVMASVGLPELSLASSAFPCDRRYFLPSLAPSPLAAFDTKCQDDGYFYALGDVMTPGAIEMKLDELQSRPNEPLLLHNVPLEDEFPPDQTRPEGLYKLQLSFYVPRVRNQPVTYGSLITFIRDHYRPGPDVLDGRFRVWVPKTAAERGAPGK